jgi:HAD superfamily hydrolase (TIGR01662 family)
VTARVVDFDVVVPTVGRESLAELLCALDGGAGPLPGRVIVVDDRRAALAPLPLPRLHALGERLVVLHSGGRGPAAARNLGWRASRAAWVAFLDDDVLPPPEWRAALGADLEAASPATAASQGRIVVPLPGSRPATDWERNVHGLESAVWATADMAYRRGALAAAGGFDERFPRAYREDSDLALRVLRRGWRVERGARHVVHPVRPADRWVSVRLQRGNADDVLMRALHGRDWRRQAHAGSGRSRRHLAATALGAAALASLPLRRPAVAGIAAAGWALLTAELAAARIAPGPRTRDEVGTMLLTSVAIPPAATYHMLRGLLALPRLLGDTAWAPRPLPVQPGAVLFDRDGTLVHDVPYNGDPARVAPLPGAREAVDRLRRAGVRVGVVSNQSGVARGLLSGEQVRAVNARVDDLVGPFDTWVVCTHAPEDGCGCRKPRPGMVLEAARRLGVPPARCVVVGDIAADLEAAAAAGAAGVLVPNPRTREQEVRDAPLVAPTIGDAVDLVLGGPG